MTERPANRGFGARGVGSESGPAAVPGPPLASYEALMARHPGVRRAAGGQDASTPRVSVVTVTLNRKQTLVDCLDSVSAQTHSGVEHVVVDGGSTDGTQALLRAREQRLGAWVSGPDGGISDAFNRGIALCRGDWIGVLNADDWYEPDAVERALEAVARHPGAGAICGRLRYVRADRPEVEFPCQPERLGVDMTVNHAALLVRRSVYERVGLYRTDLRFAMDFEWVLRARRRGVEIASVDAVLANMRWEGASDQHWAQGLMEVARAVHDTHPDRPDLHARLVLKVLKATAARTLDAVGLGALTRLYRAHLSPFRRRYL